MEKAALYLIIPVMIGLILIAGLVLLVLAMTWRPQPGKGLFIGFIFTLFLLLPLSQLGMIGLIFYLENGRNYRLNEGIIYVAIVFFCLNVILAIGLLIAYAIVRQDGDGIALSANSEKYLQRARSVWNTRLSPTESIQILRRREWALLIELVPPLTVVLLLFAIVSRFGDPTLSMGRQGQWFRLVGQFSMVAMVVVGIATPLYLLFKDSFHGVSLGKRITGCRVVDFRTGEPIGADKSILRNLLFLIPFLALVELLVASFRSDRRRLGDLLANTIVVQGPPASVDGVEVVVAADPLDRPSAPPSKHPLDD